jgi:CubicO group peptidase (beta-lactamase class C family)
MSRFDCSILLAAALAASPCGASAPAASPATATPRGDVRARLQRDVPSWLRSRHVAGAGVVVIRGGRIAWTAFFGEQGPGRRADARTMFNGASLAKTITAELTLQLAAAGRLSLDEPIAGAYADPRLRDDPRYARLTPRLILSHRSGLLNWAYAYPDGRLRFVAAPGERFGYSGAAFEILGHFLERRTGRGFEALAQEILFGPMGLRGIAVARHPWMNARVTTPMDGQGRYQPSYRTDAPENPDHPLRAGWSAAADLFTTAPDYARFLIGVMRNDGMSPEIAAARRRIVSSFAGDPDWGCSPARTPDCPTDYGFGLGWMVFHYAGDTIISNGGNDTGENALAYFSTARPGDGVVVFMNGGGIGSVRTELDIIDAIDPGQKLTAFYRQLIQAHFGAGEGR